MTPTNLPTSPVTRAARAEPKPDPTLAAAEQRRLNADFLARGAITSLANRLPLRWPTPPGSPPSPKPRYRSAYLSPDSRSLLGLDEAAWAALDNFDLVLRLVDFSGLRPVLAEKLYQASALGRVPYDPISFFLLFGWQLSNRWNRVETLRKLAEPRNADYARAFGFQPKAYPSESGYRYFLTTLGREPLHDLLVQSINLVKLAGLIPESVRKAATISFDGQIHDAASRLRCRNVGERCYQPSSAQSPRACPAKEQGKTGCACDTLACREVCKLATPRDQQARYVYYAGHNRGEQPDDPAAVALDNSTPSAAQSPNRPSTAKGEEHYGYRSLPSQLIDPVQRLSWTLDEAELAPANTREERPAGELLRRVVGEYSWLHVASAVGDAGLGYEPFLRVAYELAVRRVVDLRADPRTDHDKDNWGIRGYDDKGWAVCQFGYRLHPNGYDSQRHRTKWCCRLACECSHSPNPRSSSEATPPDCPYRDRDEHPFGRIINVAEAFADRSLRLVRDVPYGSVAWKELYRRGRNAAEGRNARLEDWNLKRLPVFGQPRSQATIFLADVWANLLQLARLVKEATLANLAQNISITHSA